MVENHVPVKLSIPLRCVGITGSFGRSPNEVDVARVNTFEVMLWSMADGIAACSRGGSSRVSGNVTLNH